MSKSPYRLLAPVLVVLVSLLVIGAVTAAPKEGLTASVSVSQSAFRSSQDVTVSVTLSNPTKHSISILGWFAVATLEEPVFTVTRDGQSVAYTGAYSKRPAPTAGDYLTIAPGESVTRVGQSRRVLRPLAVGPLRGRLSGRRARPPGGQEWWIVAPRASGVARDHVQGRRPSGEGQARNLDTWIHRLLDDASGATHHCASRCKELRHERFHLPERRSQEAGRALHHVVRRGRAEPSQHRGKGTSSRSHPR